MVPAIDSIGLFGLRRTEMEGVWTAPATNGDAIETANRARLHPDIAWAEPDLTRHVQVGARTNDEQLLSNGILKLITILETSM